METNKIYKGDAIEVLKTFPDKCIDMLMTSPPYWALRDYGVEGQLGLESTFKEYINKLCNVFDEVKRVLKDTGTIWVNMGDTYGGSGCGAGQTTETMNLGRKTSIYGVTRGISQKIMKKSLIMIPFRFAIEMVNRGWILRNTIIWYKPNCMPSSVKDRFTVDFEYIYFFSKKKKYYFEQQREPVKQSSLERVKYGLNQTNHLAKAVNVQDLDKMGNRFCNLKGRNKRCVWKICPQPFPEAHFAVFPEEICETPIQAGCPKFVCKKCGKPKMKELIREIKTLNIKRNKRDGDNDKAIGGVYQKFMEENPLKETLKTTCNCNAGFESGIVLDPFIGSGTTGTVALKQGKKFIGIELNQEYIDMANKRLKPYLEQKRINKWQENQEQKTIQSN